jgi:uncharacterized protein YndB with AHSA1/START domain
MSMEDDPVYEHESYGVIVLSRHSGGKGQLFDSPLRHDHRISIEIHEASRKRSISNDWIHPGKTIVSFEMSETQFARFITSGGMGGGTPITFTRRVIDGEMKSIETPPIDLKGEEFEREIKDISKKAMDGVLALEKEIETLTEKKTALTKEDKARLKSLIYEVTRKTRDSLPWVTKMFHEKMHIEVEHAKGEIEAFLNQTARNLGLAQIAGSVRVEAPMGLSASNTDEGTGS